MPYYGNRESPPPPPPPPPELAEMFSGYLLINANNIVLKNGAHSKAKVEEEPNSFTNNCYSGVYCQNHDIIVLLCYDLYNIQRKDAKIICTHRKQTKMIQKLVQYTVLLLLHTLY
jgi:hypothetical protein